MMKIKKYIGLTAYEATTKMKKELGSEAIILNTRSIRQKGIFGIFKKPMVEITAAYEEKDKLLNKALENDRFRDINNELIMLRNMMQTISSKVIEEDFKIPKVLDSYKKRLIKNGVECSIASSILEKLGQQINFENKDEKSIEEIVKYTLLEYLGDIQPLNSNTYHLKIIFFLGPTGVGKTTTLAKIAAQLVMKKKYEIGLITSDTYRIAAIDQLKAYSDILDIPLEVVYNQEDMYKTLAKFKGKDFIFVDTAGINYREIDQDDFIYNTIDTINNKEVYLVLSNTTDFNILKSIIDHYKFIGNYKIIFTKLDESQGFGNILNIKYLTKNPLSYITTGQDVPDDIEVLDSNKIVDGLIGERPYERSS